MLTNSGIQALIESPKRIVHKNPLKGFREENRYFRCRLELESVSEEKKKFKVFIRQSVEFIEDFSIGLQYEINISLLKIVTLIHYNGPHGEISRHSDGHYAKPHIHRITAAEIASGSMMPQEKHRKITDKYRSFEEALSIFFRDIGAINFVEHFPELRQTRLFNGQ